MMLPKASIAIGALALAFGFFAGVVTTRHVYTHSRAHKGAWTDPRKAADTMKKIYIRALEQKVRVTKEEKVLLEPLIERYAQRIVRMNRESAARNRTEFKSLLEEIRTNLSADSQARFNAMTGGWRRVKER